MPQIRTFSDGSILSRDRGSFDDWCIYLDGKPPRDVDYFRGLQAFGRKYGGQYVYDKFCEVYNMTGKVMDSTVFAKIDALAANSFSSADTLTIQKVFSILYMAMLAEENKAYTKLGKRIKRLGMYKLLIQGEDVLHAANFMRGMKWRDIDKLCREAGF